MLVNMKATYTWKTPLTMNSRFMFKSFKLYLHALASFPWKVLIILERLSGVEMIPLVLYKSHLNKSSKLAKFVIEILLSLISRAPIPLDIDWRLWSFFPSTLHKETWEGKLAHGKEAVAIEIKGESRNYLGHKAMFAKLSISCISRLCWLT